MARRELLTKPEEGLVRALVDLSTEGVVPRPGFSASLRDRLVAEAKVLEAEAAEAFNRVLEGAPATGEVAVLAGFAAALAPATPMRAPVGLRDALRTQLITSAEDNKNVISFNVERTRRSGFATRISRRLAIAAALSAMMVSTSAFAFVASANDTPVDGLYGVKIFRERAQTWFVSGTAEGMVRLRFADARVWETETMLARGIAEPDPYEVSLDNLQIQVTLASELIIEGQRTGDPAAQEAVPALATFLTEGRARIEAIEDELPDQAQPSAGDALTVFDAAVAETEAVVEGCVLCPDDTLVPIAEPTGEPADEPQGNDGSSGGILPRPNPDDSKDPDDGNNRPPVDEDPLPDDPIPTPLPDPDRIPDLPGRLDDELETIVGSIATELFGSF